MEYSDDNIARIRAALLDYHAATHSNGRKRSWSVVAEAIAADSPDLAPPDDDDDDDLWKDEGRVKDPYKPFAEALRRFAAGTQAPSKERLDAISAYLKAKKFLTDADLQPADLSHALSHALHAFFGKDHAAEALGVEGRFIASRKPVHTPARSNQPTELSVLTVRSNGTSAGLVEDRLYTLPIAPQSTKREALVRLLGRSSGSEQRFDGWLFAGKGRAAIFVQDTLRSDAGIYTLVTPAGGNKASNVVLLKSNDFGFPPMGYVRLQKVFESKPLADAALETVKDRLWVYRREDGDDGQ